MNKADLPSRWHAMTGPVRGTMPQTASATGLSGILIHCLVNQAPTEALFPEEP